jgi:4-diphosphocytidyl-2-C-methyl-D-erythritol kinase
MPEATYLAPAKINLFLHITSKRADGYHNLQTIFQLLNFSDEVTFSLRNDGKIKRIYGNETISPDKDLILRSAHTLKKYSKTKAGVDIGVTKKIPSGGGLGGGSSNAATVLIALNDLWNLKLPKSKLLDIGQTLGADVPVFVNGHSAWAEGKGDILTPINLPRFFYLVVSINKHISTQKIFTHKALTMSPVQRKISDFSLVSNPHNDCLDAAIELEGEIQQALNHLDSTENHLGVARMTGSGCCVFIAFENKEDAVLANEKLPSQWSGFVAQAIDRSPTNNWDVAKW